MYDPLVMASARVPRVNWRHGQLHDLWPELTRYFHEIVCDVMSPAEEHLSPKRRSAAHSSWSELRPGSLRHDKRPHGRDTCCTH